jgi:hypothetical protein
MAYDRPDPEFPTRGMDWSLSIQTMAGGPITRPTPSSHTKNVSNLRLDGLGYQITGHGNEKENGITQHRLRICSSNKGML